MRAPSFWYCDRRTITSWVLEPLGWIYAASGRLKNLATVVEKSDLPVICIGNFVAGGAGKTPAALEIARLLKGQNKATGFLTRGYGGTFSGAIKVMPDRHSFTNVGDEALLLAECCPTFVAKDRRAGAREIGKSDIDLIVMDDGFQNPSLFKNVSLIIIDHQQGIGNGGMIPAGPLRMPLKKQISQAHGFILNGGNPANQNLLQHINQSGKPVFTARIEPDVAAPNLKGKRVIAYSGIAMPGKFFATLEEAGAEIIERIEFPDHHAFSQSDAQWLLDLAKDNVDCHLVTTAKDHVRLKNMTDAIARLHQASLVYGVVLKFDQEAQLVDFILTGTR